MIISACILVMNVVLLFIGIYVTSIEKVGLVRPLSSPKMTKFKNGHGPDIATVVFMGACLGF